MAIGNIGKKLGTSGDGALQRAFSAVNSMSWFFQSAPINMFASRKPFKSATIYTDRYTDSNSARLAGLIAANYGVVEPATANTPVTTISTNWSYARPSGSASEPWRTWDFDGYEHTVLPPVNPQGNISGYTSGTISFNSVVRTGLVLNGLTWNNLGGIKEYYLCAVFSTNSAFTGTLKEKSSAAKLINAVSGSSIQLSLSSSDLAALQSGGYKYYYLCGRSVMRAALGNFSAGTQKYQALPYTSNTYMKGTITIETPPVPFTNYSINVSVSVAESLGDIGIVEPFFGNKVNCYGEHQDSVQYSYYQDTISDYMTLDGFTSGSTMYAGVSINDNPGNVQISISYGTISSGGTSNLYEIAIPCSYISSSRTFTVVLSST